MDLLSVVSGLVTKTLDKFLPDAMSSEEKEKIKAETTIALMQESSNENSKLREFILRYEGTAADLKGFGIAGSILILTRSSIRPLFTILTGVVDYLSFVGGVELNSSQVELLYMINMIVLTFWFGERTIKNIMPAIKGTTAK